MTDPPPPPPPPPPSYGAPPPPPGGPDAGAAISYGWRKFQENVGPLLVIFLIVFAIQILIGAFTFRAPLATRALFNVLLGAVSTIPAYGLFNGALIVTRGEPLDIGKAFSSDRWGEWCIFALVFGLILNVATALCVIPGLIFLFFFGLAPYYFIDQRMSLGDALNASRERTSTLNLGFPIILSVIVGVLGLVLCLIGVFVTAPVAYIAVAFLYRYSAGQPVAP